MLLRLRENREVAGEGWKFYQTISREGMGLVESWQAARRGLYSPKGYWLPCLSRSTPLVFAKATIACITSAVSKNFVAVVVLRLCFLDQSVEMLPK